MNTESLPPWVLRVLLAVLKAQHRGQTITLQSLCVAVHISRNSVHQIQEALQLLRDCELVTYEEGKCRTVRATCSLTIYKEALEGSSSD